MFKTKKEKTAYKAGIKKGRKGGKVWYRKKKRTKKKTKAPKPGAYNMYGRINDNLVDDRNGPVVFFDPNFRLPDPLKKKRKILPIDRDRYYVENHCVDLVDNVHDINTSYHSSYKAALAQARKQEANDKKMADHPSIAKTWFTISGPVKGKAKILKREKR